MKQVQNDGVNQSILNLITPSGLTFSKNSLMLGENFAKCLVVSKYPSNPDYGWLSKVTAIEGTTSSVQFSPTDSGALVDRCNEQIKQLRGDLTVVKEESIRQDKEKGIDDITAMIKRINQNNEVVGYLTILLLVQGTTEKILQERIKKVNSIIATFGGSTRVTNLRQKEAYQSIAPFGIPNDKLEDYGSRNMPLSTFIGGFVNSASGINDGIGYKLGKTDSGKSIIIDTWKRGGDRTNTNWFISGLPGVGKSATVKDIILNEYALGSKIIILDPEREFVDITLNLGGKVINCGGGKGGRINPLQVRPAPKIEADEILDDLYKSEDEMYKDEGHGMGDLALHFQTLRTFFKLYVKNITDIELSKLEVILEETYAEKNIFWDTNITSLEAKDFPIISDMFKNIEKANKENPGDKDIENLIAYFRSMAIGADQFIWNGPSDITADSDFIDLDTSSLLDGDDKIMKAQFFNINSWVWQQAALDRTQRILFVVDEGYLVVDPDNPGPLIFLKNFSKRIRKYEGGLIFVTHSVVDVLDPAVKRHGQALLDNACFKFIMGTDGKNLEETKTLFNLTEVEESLLLSKQRGRGLLYVGSSRLSARIEISDKFLSLMGSAGGR